MNVSIYSPIVFVSVVGLISSDIFESKADFKFATSSSPIRPSTHPETIAFVKSAKGIKSEPISSSDND